MAIRLKGDFTHVDQVYQLERDYPIHVGHILAGTKFYVFHASTSYTPFMMVTLHCRDIDSGAEFRMSARDIDAYVVHKLHPFAAAYDKFLSRKDIPYIGVGIICLLLFARYIMKFL